MKKYAFGLMALFIALTISCSKDSNSDILSTIPANTAYFAVVDLKEIQDNLGNTVEKDGKVKVDENFRKTIMGLPGNMGEMVDLMENNDATIDFNNYLATFDYKGSQVMTFYVENPGKFRDYLKSKGITFSESKGVWESKENYFMSGNQVWKTNGASTFTAQTVSYLTSLKEKESLQTNDYACGLLGKDAGIVGWVDISEMMSMIGAQNFMLSMAVNTLYENPKYIPFTVKFNEGNAQAEVYVINANFKPAKYLFKTLEVNMDQIRDYQGKGNVFFALSVDPAQIKQLSAQFGGMIGEMGGLLDILAEINGTVVGSADNTSPESSYGIEAKFSSPEAAMSAADMVMKLVPPAEGAVELTGDKLYLHTHNLEGAGIEAFADEMKGSEFAMVMTAPQGSKGWNEISKIVVKFNRDGESTVLKLRMDTKPGQNALVSILKADAK